MISEAFLKGSFQELMNMEIYRYECVEFGLSVAEKFHVWANDRQYLVKITPETVNFGIYETLKKMCDEGIRVIAAIKWKYFYNNKSTVFVYDWVPGESLETILKKCDRFEKESYGKKAAVLLKQFHSFNVVQFDWNSNPYSLYRRYDFCIAWYRATYPYLKEINAYIKDNKKIWKTCSRYSLTHQDLRPENILVSNNKLYLVDFETAGIADPYSDFVFCISMQPEYQIDFSLSLIKEYFDNDVPDEFWQWTLFYGAMAIQKYAIWKYRNKRERVKKQAVHFYNIYSGLTSTIPTFWRENHGIESGSKR